MQAVSAGEPAVKSGAGATKAREATVARDPADSVNSADIQQQQSLGSEPEAAKNSLAVSFLLKRAQHKVNHLWNPGVSDVQTDSGDRELLDAQKQSTHLSQTSTDKNFPLTGPSTKQKGSSKIFRGSTQDAPAHSGLITSANMSSLNSTDLQDVIKEAKELGFEAAVVSHHQNSTAAVSTQDDGIAAHNPAHVPVETGRNSTAGFLSSGLLTEDDDQVGLGAAFGAGQGKSPSSSSQLPSDAIGFAIDDVDEDQPASVSGDSIEALIAQTEAEEEDAFGLVSCMMPFVCACIPIHIPA